MIFINSRPVDEQAMHINDMHRRRSSLHPKQPPTSTCNSAKLGVLTSIVYLVLSAVCIVLHYPLSLLCILVPALVLFFVLASIRRKKQIDVWTSTFMATLGIFIKGAAIITYLSVFDVSQIPEQRKKGDTALHPKSIFIIVVLMCEILALIAAICLKWHLVAFRADPELVAVVNQKRKESRVMSNASYAS